MTNRRHVSCARRLTQELELKAHALSLLQERIAGSESAQLAEAVAALEADLAAAKDAAAAAKARKAQMAASAKVSAVIDWALALLALSWLSLGTVHCGAWVLH